jgi:dihydrofolate reductase
MNKLIFCANLTLDGVMQAPGRADEDTRDGFSHGGWAAPYGAMAHAGEIFANAGAMVVGRRTYESFYNAWGKSDNTFSSWFSTIPKYVVSRTLNEPLPWVNSRLIADDPARALPAIKSELNKNLLILGSRELVQSLMPHNLIDEWVLLIHPLVLGSGRRLFSPDSLSMRLSLVGSVTTPEGVAISTYRAST